jgi:hypothetical protein
MPKRGSTVKADKVWEQLYKDAVLETDDEKLPKRIQAAKIAIDARIHILQSAQGGEPHERQSICDALAGLNMLRRHLEARGPRAA